MHLINDEAVDTTLLVQLADDVHEARRLDQLLGCQVNYFVLELPDFIVQVADLLLIDRVGRQRYSRDAQVAHEVQVVFDETEQWHHHEGDSLIRHGRQLERERLAASGRNQREGVPARLRSIDNFPLALTEVGVAKYHLVGVVDAFVPRERDLPFAQVLSFTGNRLFWLEVLVFFTAGLIALLLNLRTIIVLVDFLKNGMFCANCDGGLGLIRLFEVSLDVAYEILELT